MKTNTFEPALAMIGLGGAEIVLIFVALLVLVAMIGGVVALVVWLTRRSENRNAPPPVAPTKRTCPQCGKEMSADSTQGLCPSCLMKVGLGTETANAGEPKREPAAAPAPAEIAKNFPQLEILELLGQGGMGMVYKARQPQLDRFVALKMLSPHLSRDPAFAERFNREAKALARLNHPNIVGIYDFGVAGTSASQPSTLNPQPLYYFLMEFVDGLNLSQMEQVKKRLAPEEALAIVPKICDALQYAHDEGVVHRDIKPGNILVDRKGRVKIADFGLAKLAGKEREDFSITQSRMTLGTPQYMAPEQFEDPQKVDHRADIYSLGVVFYEMLTGELPMGRFAPPSQRVQVDVRFDEVVLRALEKTPERRYQQASELKTQVETIVTTRASSAPLASAPQESEDLASARRQMKGPAIGLLLTGILNWVLIPFAFMFVGPSLFHRAGDSAARLFIIPTTLALLLLCGFIIYAALKLMHLERRGAGVLASVLALIISPGNFIGLPFGIWALIVLNRREVREAFAKKKAKPLPPLPPAMPAVKCPLTMTAWLALMDAGDYSGSWETAAPYFQRSISKEEWVARLEKVRHPLGEVLSRKIVSMTETVFGSRYEGKYESSFDGLLAATETVTYARQSNGEWQAIGYLIAPACEPVGADLKVAALRLIPPLLATVVLTEIAVQFTGHWRESDQERWLIPFAVYAIGAGIWAAWRFFRPPYSVRKGIIGAGGVVVSFVALFAVSDFYGNVIVPNFTHPDLKQEMEISFGRATTSRASTVSGKAELEFRLVAAESDTDTPADELADPNDQTGQTKLRVLREVLLDSSAVASARLTTSQAQSDLQSDVKEISIVLKKDAAKKFADITAANIGRQLAVVWRGRILSAPVIRSQISGPAVSVTGTMSDAENMVLLDLLNYKAGTATESP